MDKKGVKMIVRATVARGELRNAIMRAAMSFELFAVTWKWMLKITGISKRMLGG